MARVQKVGEVTGGKTGITYDVYYHEVSGMYRLINPQDNTDVASRVVGAPEEAMRAATEDAKNK